MYNHFFDLSNGLEDKILRKRKYKYQDNFFEGAQLIGQGGDIRGFVQAVCGLDLYEFQIQRV